MIVKQPTAQTRRSITEASVMNVFIVRICLTRSVSPTKGRVNCKRNAALALRLQSFLFRPRCHHSFVASERRAAQSVQRTTGRKEAATLSSHVNLQPAQNKETRSR